MPNLKVRYYDRDKSETVILDIPADVLAVVVPAASSEDGGLPELTVNVNTDAVIVDKSSGGRVAMYEFSDLLADADTDLAAPQVSDELKMVFHAEINNEAEGGDSPTTLGSTHDTIQQMTDDVLAEVIDEDPTSPRIAEVRAEIAQLVKDHGYNYTVEDHIDL